MPIVTPAYPSMNSSYNVGEPQLRMMKEAFAYGMDISAQIIAGQRDWTELFVDTNFFWRFADYLQVDVSAGDVESHRRWLGWIESRLRQLIVSMEQPRVMTSHPLARTIPNPEIASSGIGQVGSSFFIGLSFEPETEVVDVSSVVQDFVYKVIPRSCTATKLLPVSTLLTHHFVIIR
jgi:poly(A) polymerase